ncbi:telomere-associated protein Tap [Streptomyces sp. NPDC058683]|uniref:telomere-associated protein Tap n=1 Tax=Streptomyces sp. NPDC058683 TaxID=3346597 RepID=UPI00364B60A9
MTDQPQELFTAVDSLLAAVDDGTVLPAPDERVRLREAAGLTEAAVAQALGVRVPSIQAWEAGRSEPRGERLEAYRRLLEGLARRYPAPAPSQRDSARRPYTAAAVPAAVPTASATVASNKTSTSRSPSTQDAASTNAPVTGADARFTNGPLLVVDADDHQTTGYGVGGLIMDVPAKSLPALVEWTLKEARLGQPRLSGAGKDGDPLIVLTETACRRYGLPVTLTDEQRLAGRLPEGHKVIKELVRADWKLTQRGFGPWARIYRPAQGSERSCVQLCIPSWNALDARSWGDTGQLEPADLARLLGVYAARVMTPRGSTAVTGLELLTALHPPTRASAPDDTGRRHSVHNPGSLGKDPVDPAPCEAPDGHPVLADLPRFHRRTPAEKLFEEALDWARPLTDDECLRPNLVGIDVNLAFAAGANGLTVGLGAPTHVKAPVFDPKLPGTWLVDLSHVDLSRVKLGKEWVQLDGGLLPSPFTPSGEQPTGPAWYATPTVAYAAELGYEITPVEAWVRYDNGRYLDGWYNRLRDAYIATMADLGVHTDMTPEEFLMARHGLRERDPQLAVVVDAIKMTAKGTIGKFAERPRGEGWKPGQPWRALARPTWRPDIRAAVISRTRTNMHRKILKHAAFTGQYPVAILSDCVVYAVNGTGPIDFLPYRDGKPLPGGWRIGVSPGMVKHEGTQSVLWGEGIREQFNAPELNLARYIKTGEVTNQDTGE